MGQSKGFDCLVSFICGRSCFGFPDSVSDVGVIRFSPQLSHWPRKARGESGLGRLASLRPVAPVANLQPAKGRVAAVFHPERLHLLSLRMTKTKNRRPQVATSDGELFATIAWLAIMTNSLAPLLPQRFGVRADWWQPPSIGSLDAVLVRPKYYWSSAKSLSVVISFVKFTGK